MKIITAHRFPRLPRVPARARAQAPLAALGTPGPSAVPAPARDTTVSANGNLYAFDLAGGTAAAPRPVVIKLRPDYSLRPQRDVRPERPATRITS